jgi:hypothetical protein
MFKYSDLNKKSQNGAVIVLVAILLVVFLGVAALAIDVYHLFVVRNELQNAADAAALAGAKVLYYDFYDNPSDPDDDNKLDNDPDNDPPSADLAFTVNPGANIVAYKTALENISENIAVEVKDHTSNTGDIQRGHWSFSAEKAGRDPFQADSYLTPVNVGNYTNEQLDDPDRNGPSGDIRFINAVKVVVRRQDKPAASFFAQIFGYENFGLTAEAIAYIGFAGGINPFDVDLPIAICRQAIIDDDGNFNASIGRFINSSGTPGTNPAGETGGWTDFNQEDDPCKGGTNNPLIKNAIDNGGNSISLVFGASMATDNGAKTDSYKALMDKWEEATNKESFWNVTLPVIDCSDNNIGTCETLVGAVNVDIVWITSNGEDPQYKEVPAKMESWVAPAGTGEYIWNEFVEEFELKNVDDTNAPYQKSAIYFRTNGEAHGPVGPTGGANFGILARIPKLVK